ncbi:TIGR04222 domain-containing membrane protein [Kitasatospora sp. NPDC089797]|uniref:TIGR04222 domain-containing membrane protein n=1 Tax=Kitasatospora sp. NPDC089797 TaxID=3155298 RepID=UPI00343A00A6
MWHNSYFLIPAVLLIAATVHAARARQRVRHVPHPQGLPGGGLPLLDTAFLAGGPGRVVDTALVRMHLSEQAVVNRAGLLTLTGARPYDTVDQAVHDAVGTGRSRELGPLRRTVMGSAAVREIGDRLADRGLMRRPELLRRAVVARRLLWLAVLDVLLFAGLALLVDGNDPLHDRPDLRIPALLLVVGAVALATGFRADGRVTPAGQRQLALLRGAGPWTPSAGVSPRLTGGALLGAVALGGLAAASLDDPELEAALLAATAEEEVARQASSSFLSSSSASSSSASSSGGSSCGAVHDAGSSHHHHSSCGSSHHSSCGSSHSSSCGSSHSGCGSSCGSGCGGS